MISAPLILGGVLSGAVGANRDTIDLKSSGDLIDFYIDRRYQYEVYSNRQVSVSLEELREVLGGIARRMWEPPWDPQTYISDTDIQPILIGHHRGFLEVARTLYLFVPSKIPDAWEFPHLAFRDHFAVPELIKALSDINWRVRHSAADALNSIGSAAVDAISALIQSLADKDKDVGRAAALALGSIGSASVPALIRALRYKDKDVGRAAALALGSIGSASVPALIRALRYKDNDVRRAAADALGRIGPAAVKAITGLTRVVRCEKDDVRLLSSAVDALGMIGPAAARAIPELINLHNHTEERVQSSVAIAVGRIQPVPIPEPGNEWRSSMPVDNHPINVHITDEVSDIELLILGNAASLGPPRGINPRAIEAIESESYPSEKQLIRELDAFRSILSSHGVTIHGVAQLENLNQIFVRDLGFVVDDCFVVARMKVEERQKEIKALEPILSLIDRSKIINPPDGVYIEGGDVVTLGNTLFVGTGRRTNEAAVSFLCEAFPQKDVIAFKMRHDTDDPRTSILHLDCAFQPVGSQWAILYAEGFITSPQAIIDIIGDQNIIPISSEEMYRLCPNIFSLSPSKVVSSRSFTRLNGLLRDRGIEVITTNYDRVAILGGLFRCSTLPLRRKRS